MNDDKTTITTTVGGVRPGDLVSFAGDKKRYIIVDANDHTLTIKPLRWYHRLYRAVRLSVRLAVRRVSDFLKGMEE